MRNSKSDKYKTYGPIPKNEYANTNAGKSTDAADVLEHETNPVDMAYKQRLAKRQAIHPSGRRKTHGWSRFWKANGWRAESAALHDEASDTGRDSTYV